MERLICSSAVALTPVGSIAKPTDSSGAADPEITSSKAVPASSPKPTIAPITSSSQDRPPAKTKTDLPKKISDSIEKPSTSLASDVTEQSDHVENKAAHGDDQLDNGNHPPSHFPVTPTENVTPPSSPANGPTEPDAVRPGASASDGLPTGKNALSVLLEAQSSAKAADPAQSAQDDVPSNDKDLATETLDPVTTVLADGSSATILAAESSLIVAHNGLSVGAMRGNEVTIGTHAFSAVSNNDAVVIDKVATHAAPASANSPPALAISADGRMLSASHQGSDVLIFDEHQTLTVHAGEAITIGSQTISVNSGASGFVLGTATLAIPTKAKQNTAFATAVWTADGSAFTAFKQDNSIVVHGPDVTTALEPGATATIAGDILSVPSSGGLLMHDGATAAFKPSDTAASDVIALTTLLPNGQELLASTLNGDSIVIQHGSSRLTLAAGEQTIVNGETVSVAQSDRVLVVGSETISLMVPSSTTVGSSSGSFTVHTPNEASPSSTDTDPAEGPAGGDDEGAGASASEPESLSGAVGRGHAASLAVVLPLVCLVACLL